MYSFAMGRLFTLKCGSTFEVASSSYVMTAKLAWCQNIPPNRNCFARRGLRDDQNQWFNRLQWLTGGRPGEMGFTLQPFRRHSDQVIVGYRHRQNVRTLSMFLSIERSRSDESCR